jgi:signal transduction histidine kinase
LLTEHDEATQATLAEALRATQQELRATQQELRAARAELKRMDGYKDEFLAVMSHELRTPLNFITGFASVLEDEVSGPLNALQRQHVGRILLGADRMVCLVEDLLDIASIQAGKITVTRAPTSYDALVEEVFSALAPQAAAKQLDFRCEIETSALISVDRRRIAQVLRNLLGNAIKFTQEGGAVGLRAYDAQGVVVTEIGDSGPGIAPEEASRIFEKFQQLDMSPTRQTGGSGLGLAIAKALVEAHSGTIGLHSTPGMGCTFWFELPHTPSL